MPEDRRIFSELSVLENLEVGRQPEREGAPAWSPEKLFRLFPNLGEMRERPGGQMSGGEQQMLTVARTLMGNPYLVLLDEPSEGIAPRIVEDMANMILELKQEGLAVVLSEQNLHFARLVSDRAYVIEERAGALFRHDERAGGERGGEARVPECVTAKRKLEAQTLWERIDAKLAGFGGCAQVP